jgi:serine/threonine protein kinase
MWSIGVILYILVCGHPPFDGKTTDELVDKIKKADFSFAGRGEWEDMAPVKNLIYELLQYSPIDRMEACVAANHDFFTKILLNEDRNGNNRRAQRDPNIIQNMEFFYVRNSINLMQTCRENCN